MQAAGQLAQLAAGDVACSRAAARRCERLRVRRARAARGPAPGRGRRAAAGRRRAGRGRSAGAPRRRRGRRGRRRRPRRRAAQALVAAALELGGRAGAKTCSACSSLGSGSMGAWRRRRCGRSRGRRRCERDRQVAVERCARRNGRPGSAGARRGGRAAVVLVGVLAGVPSARTRSPRAAPSRARRRGDRARVAGALLAQLGDEGDLGVERGELGDEPAQEGGADDPAVPAARRLSRSRSRISAAVAAMAVRRC